MKYLLAVDIGNTMIGLAVLKQGKIVKEYHVQTRLAERKLRNQLKKVLRTARKNYKVKTAVICSVVPSISGIVKREIRKQGWSKPIVIGQDLVVPIRNNYRNPKQVGQDRLVCAYAVKKLYGTPAIVIDFGTAITFDFVSGKGSYEGGIIVPGIRLSAESLFHKTALLPRIETIASPRRLIGKTTQESILSGIFFGYGALACGLIDLIARSIKGRPKVIVTGGYTTMMRRFIVRKIDKIDSSLVYKGIYHCYQDTLQ